LQEGLTRIPENQKTGSNPLSFRLQHCLTYVKEEEEPGEIWENAPSLKEPVTGSVADWAEEETSKLLALSSERAEEIIFQGYRLPGQGPPEWQERVWLRALVNVAE
jgi:hypothetical protein